MLEQSGFANRRDSALESLATALAAAKVYVSPDLRTPGLSRDASVTFSAAKRAPRVIASAREDHLRGMIEAQLGKGELQHLVRPRREYELADRRRVDIVCDDLRERSKRGITAIELKTGKSGTAAQQLVRYMEQLRKQHPDRTIRGVLISQDIDDATLMFLRNIGTFQVDCYRCSIELQRMR